MLVLWCDSVGPHAMGQSMIIFFLYIIEYLREGKKRTSYQHEFLIIRYYHDQVNIVY